MLNRLGGEVTSSKFFTGKFGTINEDGLLSESIFGPINDFRCKCGKLHLESCDGGKICDRCGVLCGSSDLRLKTFGKISLTFPVIKPTKIKYFKKIVGLAHKHLLDPNKADALSITSRYLIVSFAADEFKITDTINPINGYYTIPIRITGLYSFILSLKYVAYILNLDIAKELFEKEYIIDYIKVLPPDIRPVVKDTKGKDRYVEVNKHYASLLNLNKMTLSTRDISRQKEKDWFEKMKYNLENGIEDELVEFCIPEYDTLTAKYQHYVDLVYTSVFASISGKTGFIRGSILGKTIEFSARSVIVIDPSLEPHKVKVSRKILYKLWFPYFLNYLAKYKIDDYVILFDNYAQFENYDLYKLEFDEFLKWFCSPQEQNQEIEEKSVSESVKSLIRRRKIELEYEEDEFD